MFALFYLVICLCICGILSDRLEAFYDRLKENDVKRCADPTRLLPDCKQCIPGLQQGKGSSSCNEFVKESNDIRNEIEGITKDRYPNLPKNRRFGLYPYLEKDEFVVRQVIFGGMLSKKQAKNILDIGAYYNPINLFMDKSSCPESVVIVEPILDPISVMVPCSSGAGSTHFLVSPVTFKYYIKEKAVYPVTDTVVCIGCDSHYGPNRRMLETTFNRPYELFIEYPSEYVHNAPFKKMMGTGPGEKMSYIHKFQVNTNDTIYTKRVMKVIEYSVIPSE